MSSYETETLKLIDAVPVKGEWLCGMCPTAYDASGTKISCFEAAALNEGVAETLHEGESIWVNGSIAQDLVREARFNDPERMREYAACLLTRASGKCIRYDAEEARSRTDEETSAYMRSSQDV